MAFQLTVENVNFSSDGFPLMNSSFIDSLNSVVDANIDFKPISTNGANSECDEADLAKNWKTDMDHTTYQRKLNDQNLSLSDGQMSFNKPEMNANTEKPTVSLNEANLAFSYDSIATTYPKIPLPVAQFMNENNPEWCAEAERYLKLDEVPDLIQNQYCKHLDNFNGNNLLSPLKSMAASSNALSLQQSVIGNPCTVSNNMPKDSKYIQGVNKTSAMNSTNGIFFTQSSDSSRNTDKIPSECVRYPSSSIQSVTEKKSWFSNFNKSTPDVPKATASSISLKNLGSRRSSGSSLSSQNSRTYSVSDTKIPHVHSSKNLKSFKVAKEFCDSQMSDILSNKFQNSSVDWENESCFSEKLEAASLCSDTYETESNFSEISGLDEEMFQVKKLLADVENDNGVPNSSSKFYNNHMNNKSVLDTKLPCSKSTVISKDQATETEGTELFELMRIKANLEGRLESSTKHETELVKERTVFQATVTSLQAQVKASLKQAELAVSEKQCLQKELDMQKMQQEKWDNIVKEYVNIAERKDAEIRGFKENLSEVEQANIQSRINFEELKVDVESKEGVIIGLKKKIAEQHVESQVLLQGKIQLENEVKNNRHEISALQKSRSWYQDQLRLSQENCSKLHQEITTAKANQVSLQSSVERYKTDVNNLNHQLKESQNRAVTEKDMMMRHLETVMADVKEREALFEQIQKDKGFVEDALTDRVKKIEDEKSEITKLTYSLIDLQEQLKLLKSDVKDKDTTLLSLEKEKADLFKQIVLLQKSMNEKELSNQHLSQELRDSLAKIEHLETTLQDKDDLVSKLKEEKTATDVALASAINEKRMVNESLCTFKENLNYVENNFKQLQVKLVTKTSHVEQLTKEKNALEESLRKLEEGILTQQKAFKMEILNQTQHRDIIVDDLHKKNNELEHIVSVYGDDLHKYQVEIQRLENESKDLKDKTIKLQIVNKNSEERLESLNTENVVLKEQISTLAVQLKEANTAGSNINSIELVSELRKKNRKQTFLLRKLKEKIKQVKDLQEKLTEVEEMLSQSSGNINEELSKEKNNVASLQNELKMIQDSLEKERKQNEKNQALIIEFEKDKGKTSAISDSNNALKATITELEATFLQKDELIAQLSCQVTELETKLSENIISYDRKIRNLEEDLNKERTTIKGLRQQVFQEMRNNSHLQRQLTSLKSGLEQANQTADARKKDLIAIQSDMEQQLQLIVNYRSECEHLQTVICNKQSEIEKMKKEIEDINARDPALANQIKLLSRCIQEKKGEIEALKNNQNLIEERHQGEISALEKQIENLKSDIKRYKSQLKYSNQEKSKYYAELRKMLKIDGSKLPHKLASDDMTKKEVIDFYFPDPQSNLDESYINSLLDKSFLVPDSSPLNELQECLNSLKSEMVELQKQIHETTDK